MGSRTSVIWLLAMCGFVSSEPYTPGTPGAEWSEVEIEVTRHKILELIDLNNHVELLVQTPWEDQIPIPLWDECCDSNPDYNGDRAAQRAPTENKLLRLAFHDCFKYTDGTGGCDGCINWKGMGYSYKKLFRSPHALPKTFKVENNGTNNDLGVTAKYLELIYESDADNNWPPTSPVLEKSLKNTGKSRADLWQFAGNVALELAIERANFACDHDYTQRQQTTLLEGREKCEIKLTKPVTFQYGRKDCIPTNAERPFETWKEEFSPMIHGSGEQILSFMAEHHKLSARDTISLMGIHSVIVHPTIPTQNEIEGLRYKWIGTPYLGNIYYKEITGVPMYMKFDDFWKGAYSSDTQSPAVGDKHGNPVGKTHFKAVCENAWDAPDGGPCFFRPTSISCSSKMGGSGDLAVTPCFKIDEDGSYVKKTGKARKKTSYEELCGDATMDEQGVQHGGELLNTWRNAGKTCKFGNNKAAFALNSEIGFYYNFTVDEYHRPRGCPELDNADFSKVLQRATDETSTEIISCGKTTSTSDDGEKLTKIMDEYATDHDIWANDFLSAWQKIGTNGYQGDELHDGPESSWLGYFSLKEANGSSAFDTDKYDGYEAFIEANSPVWFTRKDVNPFACGECSWKMLNPHEYKERPI